MILGTLIGAMILILVSDVAILEYSPSALVTGLATSTVDVE